MPISTSYPCMNYSLRDAVIIQATEEKSFGVIIDHQLKFHEQTTAVCSSVEGL